MNNQRGGLGVSIAAFVAWAVMLGLAFIVLGLVYLGCREVFDAIVESF